VRERELKEGKRERACEGETERASVRERESETLRGREGERERASFENKIKRDTFLEGKDKV
jgi:hypothetical protein